MSRLSVEFFDLDTPTLAQRLLGKVLVHETPAGTAAGRIVETEAYLFPHDRSAHSFRGQTERNAAMFGPAGRAYVYFTYGMHYCMNVVAQAKGEGVLLRALEPLEGLELMAKRRKLFPGVDHASASPAVASPAPAQVFPPADKLSAQQLKLLCSGPAKLTQALGIDRAQYGWCLRCSSLYLLDAPGLQEEEIVTTTRIGIRESVELPLRFFIRNNSWISKK